MAGKVAIVTGAGLGLGRLYALALAERGAKVLVNDYGGDLEGTPGTIAVAQTVVDEIKAKGGVAVAHGGDVSKDYKDIVETAVREFGTVHILINNAGVMGKMSPHDDVDAASFMRVMEISILGTAMVTSACYSIMAKQKYGRIINASSNSMYGLGSGGDCAYTAAKAAAFAMTRQLGRWSERDGIKINCTMPSAASRMGDLSEGTKFVTRTYFPAEVCVFGGGGRLCQSKSCLSQYTNKSSTGLYTVHYRSLQRRVSMFGRGLHDGGTQSSTRDHGHISRPDRDKHP
jgi:NAD(P)-dependent dehydrogenase (short-subunit alcohol dehydrogenase family)